LRIPYKKLPLPNGGFGYHAILGVYIALPGKNAPRSKKIEAYIDSGASRTTFHASIGKALGFEVEKGELEEAMGISGKPSKTYLHDMAFYVPGGVIQIRGAFSNDLPVAGILGMGGFFEHFRVTFDPTVQGCELERIYQA
jgi:hypothetical protein